MTTKQPTYSVRLGSLSNQELWLNNEGRWDEFENRKRFKDQDQAETFVKQQFGDEFHNYGIFPNS